MKKVTLENLRKVWKDFIAVDGVNLEIEEGEFFVLLGPSGCGKTTTLRMIAGLEEITSGNIYIGDKQVNHFLPKDRDIAMVFQNYGLYPHMNVRDNIAYPLKIRKIPKNEHEERILQAAKKVKMETMLDKKPGQLSGGQRQRVALARAIVRKPSCFLMDEPLSNLDAKLRVSTRGEIKLLQKELQTTTIYVTHDQVEAMTMAHRVAVMNNGKVAQLGTPSEIYSNPSNVFVAGFIGSPPMNLISGEVKSNLFQAPNIKVKLKKAPQEKNIYLGFRAEDVKVLPTSSSKSEADFRSKIYNIEYLGDSTLITLELNDKFIIIKTDKRFETEMGNNISIKILPENIHCFSLETGEKIS